jgi:hypothetical protein
LRHRKKERKKDVEKVIEVVDFPLKINTLPALKKRRFPFPSNVDVTLSCSHLRTSVNNNRADYLYTRAGNLPHSFARVTAKFNSSGALLHVFYPE